MADENERLCLNCRFFEIDDAQVHETQGLCRRHAPRAVWVLPDSKEHEDWLYGGDYALSEHRTIWPQVDERDWCGDWQ